VEVDILWVERAVSGLVTPVAEVGAAKLIKVHGRNSVLRGPFTLLSDPETRRSRAALRLWQLPSGDLKLVLEKLENRGRVRVEEIVAYISHETAQALRVGAKEDLDPSARSSARRLPSVEVHLIPEDASGRAFRIVAGSGAAKRSMFFWLNGHNLSEARVQLDRLAEALRRPPSFTERTLLSEEALAKLRMAKPALVGALLAPAPDPCSTSSSAAAEAYFAGGDDEQLPATLQRDLQHVAAQYPQLREMIAQLARSDQLAQTSAASGLLDEDGDEDEEVEYAGVEDVVEEELDGLAGGEDEDEEERFDTPVALSPCVSPAQSPPASPRAAEAGADAEVIPGPMRWMIGGEEPADEEPEQQEEMVEMGQERERKQERENGEVCEFRERARDEEESAHVQETPAAAAAERERSEGETADAGDAEARRCGVESPPAQDSHVNKENLLALLSGFEHSQRRH